MARTPLLAMLNAQRSEMATAAQSILDDWQQDAEGYDEVFGAGGACDAIAGALEVLLSQKKYTDAGGHKRTPSFMPGGHAGDDHAWLIAFDDHEAVVVDLPPHVYETGGGFSWRKIPGVVVKPRDFVLDPFPRSHISSEDADSYD